MNDKTKLTLILAIAAAMVISMIAGLSVVVDAVTTPSCGGCGRDLMECFDCDGTGECTECSSYAACPHAGECASCGGTGEFCYPCVHQARVDAVLRESGMSTTPTAAPNHNYNPKNNYNNGYAYDDGLDICFECGGAGRIKCYDCVTGSCIQCGGDGEIPSYAGGDIKYRDCAYCSGGRCRKCSGRAEVDCPYC